MEYGHKKKMVVRKNNQNLTQRSFYDKPCPVSNDLDLLKKHIKIIETLKTQRS